MTRFLVRRLILLLLGVLIASVLIFFALRVLPGDIALRMAGLEATPERIEALRERYGLDRSLAEQYFDWILGVFRLDLGNSLMNDVPIVSELVEKLQVTVPLGLMALLIGLLIAVPLGIYSALKHSRVSGSVVSFAAQAVAAIPVVWLGLILISNFAIHLEWFPAQRFPQSGWQDPLAALHSLVLPALTIGLVEGAVLLRFVRSAVLEALNQDYVRAGAARGLSKTAALIRHGMPNVGLSVVSILGIQIAALLTGAVVIEQLFTLPGIGRMLVVDVGNRDLIKVQSTIMVLTVFVLIIGTVVDIIHRTVDPRQRERR